MWRYSEFVRRWFGRDRGADTKPEQSEPDGPPIGVTKPHHWSECEPVILRTRLDGNDEPMSAREQVDLQRTSEAMQAVLSRMRRSEREAFQQAFHQLCCFNSRDPQVMATVNRVISVVQAELRGPDYT